ncbi:hypothetical protein LRP88_09306 [Fusarium phalaenopsidis]
MSIALITLNCIGFFTGDELLGLEGQGELKLGLLQVAAKHQELLIVASVGSVIFHLIRSELVFGDGMILGLLVSGFSFSQPSYFWSPEFLGSLGWSWGHGEIVSHGQRWKRCGFILLVFIGGALALLAGPETAVLMIPRKMDWPVDGGIYWLNGSDDQLWPKFLDAAYYSEINCTFETSQFTDNRCPSHSLLPMYQHFISWWNGYNTGYGFEQNDGWQRKMIYARPALLSDANTWAYSAHAPTAVLQDALRGYHFKALKYLAHKRPDTKPFPRRLDWAKPKRYEVEIKVSAARVYCELQGIMDYGKDLTVKLPNLKGLDEYWKDKGIRPEMEMHGAKVLDEVDVLGDVQRALAARGILRDEESAPNESIFDNRRDKLIVATDIWDATKNSLGLVILFKDLFNRTNVTADISPPSNVVACSIDARWAKGKTIIQTTDDYPIHHEYYSGKVLNLIQTELDFLDPMGYVRARPPPYPMMEDIRFSLDWYEMLSPTLPDTSPDYLPWMPIHGSNRTTLETLLISVYNDELARKLLHNGDPKEIFPEPVILKSENSTRREMKAIYNGYVMTAKDWFDYLCMVCLGLHAAIAIVHTFFCCLHQAQNRRGMGLNSGTDRLDAKIHSA